MQNFVLVLALVSVPSVQHSLQSLAELKPNFTGEKSLILEYCHHLLPVVQSTYPGPSMLPTKIITSCVPKQGNRALQVVCTGEYTCVVNETQMPSVELAKLIEELLASEPRP